MSTPELQEREEAYKDWLREEHEKDERDRRTGLSPLPRSVEERLAIFYSLPPEMRRRSVIKFRMKERV